MEKSAVDPTPDTDPFHTPDSAATKSDIEAPPVQTVQKEKDADLVDWHGPDDPENPFNWPSWKKWRQLIFMAINTFLTYVKTRGNGIYGRYQVELI